MTEKHDAFEYDVSVSFAEADRTTAETLASLLRDRNRSVFLDEYSSSAQWGNTVDHLVNLYARKARYCVLLISRRYPLRAWTEAERTSAREGALRDAEEYILPLRLDDTDVPGIEEVKGYRDLREDSIERVVNWLGKKLSETESHSGPPSQSHDLRSGNVPSAQPAPDDS